MGKKFHAATADLSNPLGFSMVTSPVLIFGQHCAATFCPHQTRTEMLENRSSQKQHRVYDY
jgi:hypothetical protein